MNRRTLLQSLAAATGALLLPPSLEENAEAVRRYWQLDRTMVRSPLIIDRWEQEFTGEWTSAHWTLLHPGGGLIQMPAIQLDDGSWLAPTNSGKILGLTIDRPAVKHTFSASCFFEG